MSVDMQRLSVSLPTFERHTTRTEFQNGNITSITKTRELDISPRSQKLLQSIIGDTPQTLMNEENNEELAKKFLAIHFKSKSLVQQIPGLIFPEVMTLDNAIDSQINKTSEVLDLHSQLIQCLEEIGKSIEFLIFFKDKLESSNASNCYLAYYSEVQKDFNNYIEEFQKILQKLHEVLYIKESLSVISPNSFPRSDIQQMSTDTFVPFQLTESHAEQPQYAQTTPVSFSPYLPISEVEPPPRYKRPTALDMLYKTKICSFYKLGFPCPNEPNCRFAHGKKDQRVIKREKEPELCRHFLARKDCLHG